MQKSVAVRWRQTQFHCWHASQLSYWFWLPCHTRLHRPPKSVLPCLIYVHLPNFVPQSTLLSLMDRIFTAVCHYQVQGQSENLVRKWASLCCQFAFYSKKHYFRLHAQLIKFGISLLLYVIFKMLLVHFCLLCVFPYKKNSISTQITYRLTLESSNKTLVKSQKTARGKT